MNLAILYPVVLWYGQHRGYATTCSTILDPDLMHGPIEVSVRKACIIRKISLSAPPIGRVPHQLRQAKVHEGIGYCRSPSR